MADVVGGMAAAAISAMIGWNTFKLIRVPEVGPWVILIAAAILPGAMRNPLLQIAILFLAIVALVLTGEGGAWRRRRDSNRILQQLKAGAGPVHRAGSIASHEGAPLAQPHCRAPAAQPRLGGSQD